MCIYTRARARTHACTRAHIYINILKFQDEDEEEEDDEEDGDLSKYDLSEWDDFAVKKK